MNKSQRWLVGTLVSTAALSNAALIWWAPVAIISTAATMPYRISASDPSTWAIAAGVQVLFSAVIILGRFVITRLPGRHRSATVIVAIMAAGAVRGFTLVVAASLVAGRQAMASELLLRAINSFVLALLGLGVLGVIIQFTREYRREYLVLSDRARRLHREISVSAPTISDATIAGWVGVQRSLRSTTDSARVHLGPDDASAESLRAAAQVIGDALTEQVRPISQGLWVGSSDEPPRLRGTSVAWAALRPWHPPAIAIVIFAVLVGLGAINRAGVIDGGIFALYSTITFAGIFALSTTLGARYPHSRLVGGTTLLLTPVLIIAVSVAIGQGILRTQADIAGALITGIAASVVLSGTVFVRRIVIEREVLLDELQARIDAQGIALLAQRAEQDPWRESLGTFVHHSVQSELTALRMQLIEAASTQDPLQRTAARADVLQRFDRLVTLQPPWTRQLNGRTMVNDVAEAWSGIANVTVDMTDAGTQAQWETAGLVVEEGVANAVRAGRATNVHVRVGDDAGVLVVEVEDDGHGLAESNRPGGGTWWLDRIAPGNWDRSSTSAGTHLTVRIR